MRHVRLTLIASSLLAASAIASAQAQNSATSVGGVLISPLLHRISARPSEAATVEFDLANPTTGGASATLEVLPFVPKPGSYESVLGQAHPQDASIWFASNRTDVVFKAGEQKHIALKLKIPGGAKGVYWAMVRCLPKLDSAGKTQTIAYEIPVVLTVGKVERAVVNFGTPSVELAVPGATRGLKVVRFGVENAGPGFTPIGAEGTVYSLPSNRVVAHFEVGDRNLFPSTKRDLTFALPTLPDGRYRVDVRPELGRKQLPAVSSEFLMTGGVPQSGAALKMHQLSPLELEPAGFSDEMPRGANRSQTLRITNLSDRAMDVDLKVMGVSQSANGSVGAVEKAPVGLEITVDQPTVHLEPKGSTLARLGIKVTPDADGDVWYALTLSEKGNAQAIAETTFGNVSVKGTRKPAMEVTVGDLQKSGDRLVAVKFSTKNTGNVAVRPEPSATILEDGVRLTARLDVPVVGDGGFLPGCVIPNQLFLPTNLKPGNYTLEIAYQYTESDTARLRVPFTVKAPTAPAAPAKGPKKG